MQGTGLYAAVVAAAAAGAVVKTAADDYYRKYNMEHHPGIAADDALFDALNSFQLRYLKASIKARGECLNIVTRWREDAKKAAEEEAAEKETRNTKVPESDDIYENLTAVAKDE